MTSVYSDAMARYTLVYGVRLVKEGSVTAVDDARLSLKDGTTAGLTLHTIDGTIPQLRRALDRSSPHGRRQDLRLFWRHRLDAEPRRGRRRRFRGSPE